MTPILPENRTLIGTASVEEAKRLRDQVHEATGIPLILERNPDCKSGCAVKIDLYVEPDHETALKEYFAQQQAIHADDPDAFNTANETAKCPACGTEFSTKLTECPDCGLGFGVPGE